MTVRNVLFIMCDQLRLDALSCFGTSEMGSTTPNIDALARRGVRFDRAYAQGAVCGSSRMSFYTGRYVQSHGSRWNRVPLNVGEQTLGDYMRPLGVRPVLVGKTHHVLDQPAFRRLGLTRDSPEAIFASECGFDPEVRDDGLHPDQSTRRELPYNVYLRDRGYEGPNPWHTAANAVVDADGAGLSGWFLKASRFPAIVAEEHSETAYMTNRAIDYIGRAGDEPWCLHLSYIKPHWPYVAPAPYHRSYSRSDLPEPNRSADELDCDHPVIQALQRSRVGSSFSDDAVRDTVYPAYLGLVKQIDQHIGRLMAFLQNTGRLDDTMIVLTSDHGDYLGDHWMGDKDYLHDEIVRIPMIVVDPSPAADRSRGAINHEMVEAIDLVPTFIDALGGDLDDSQRWLEGRSLLPLLGGGAWKSRDAVFSETDYGFIEMYSELSGSPDPEKCRATMVRTNRFKYIFHELYPPQLFDLENDPHERVDLGRQAGYEPIRRDHHDLLFEWFRHRKHSPTIPKGMHEKYNYRGAQADSGILIGYWDQDHLDA